MVPRETGRLCPCIRRSDWLFAARGLMERARHTMDRKQQPRLGRGLDSLFGGDNGQKDGHHTLPASRVATSSIRPNPYQPRKSFDEDELKKLEDSIRAHGILAPLLVRPVTDGYQLIAGERR